MPYVPMSPQPEGISIILHLRDDKDTPSRRLNQPHPEALSLTYAPTPYGSSPLWSISTASDFCLVLTRTKRVKVSTVYAGPVEFVCGLVK